MYDRFDGPYPARVRIAIVEKHLQSQVRFESVNLWTGEHGIPGQPGRRAFAHGDDTDGKRRHPHDEPACRTGTAGRDRYVFHHATPGLGPKVELYQNAEWGLRQRDRALRAFAYFDGLLKTQPYIAGMAFSMVDITVIGAFIFAAIVKLDVPPRYTALHAWHARMQERPSVKAWHAMVDETRRREMPLAGVA